MLITLPLKLISCFEYQSYEILSIVAKSIIIMGIYNFTTPSPQNIKNSQYKAVRLPKRNDWRMHARVQRPRKAGYEFSYGITTSSNCSCNGGNTNDLYIAAILKVSKSLTLSGLNRNVLNLLAFYFV